MLKGVVVLGFDAAGRQLALTAIKEAIEQAGHPVRIDELSGTADYPDVAESTCRAVVEPDVHSGILVCGTGIGMSIAANKMPGILAAHCSDIYSVEKARRNAGANVLTFGSELMTPAMASALVGTWLAHEFDSESSIPKVERVRALDQARSGG